jgi:pimeloyl-ACP methyl ester carboxylesterase
LDSAAPEDSEHETNRDFVHSKLMAQANQSKPLTLTNLFGQIAALSTHRMTRERLQKVLDYSIHFLVIVGQKDEVDFQILFFKIFSPESSFQLSDILNCKLEKMEDAGHGLTFEKKNVVNSLIEAHFLEASKLSNRNYSYCSSVDTLAEVE